VALAARALRDKEVKRIVLTRPAVEAGESLDFYREILKKSWIRIYSLYMMHFVI
jgi:phosphate starvation-inducible PhoH-like protein